MVEPKAKDLVGFWSGMTTGMKLRLFLGLAYVLAILSLFQTTPILAVVGLMVPLFWSVGVLWIGSEKGRSFGPYSQPSNSVFHYVLHRVWAMRRVPQLLLSILGVVLLTSGLGWISTEKLRAEMAKPTLTERAVTVAEEAKQSTSATAKNWFSTARGWFSSDDSHSP